MWRHVKFSSNSVFNRACSNYSLLVIQNLPVCMDYQSKVQYHLFLAMPRILAMDIKVMSNPNKKSIRGAAIKTWRDDVVREHCLTVYKPEVTYCLGVFDHTSRATSDQWCLIKLAAFLSQYINNKTIICWDRYVMIVLD